MTAREPRRPRRPGAAMLNRAFRAGREAAASRQPVTRCPWWCPECWEPPGAPPRAVDRPLGESWVLGWLRVAHVSWVENRNNGLAVFPVEPPPWRQPWGAADLYAVEIARSLGLPYREIAWMLGRSETAVRVVASRLGVATPRAAAPAERARAA